jgi:hypothetical protein
MTAARAMELAAVRASADPSRKAMKLSPFNAVSGRWLADMAHRRAGEN